MGRVTDWILEHLPPVLRPTSAWTDEQLAAQDERDLGQSTGSDPTAARQRAIGTIEPAAFAATRDALPLADSVQEGQAWRAAMRQSIEQGRAEDEARWEREGAIYERLGLAEAERREQREAGPDWTEERLPAQDARDEQDRDEQDMETPRDYRADLARELIDRYGADRMHEVVQRLEEMPLHQLAEIREHEVVPDEVRAAVDERIDRASTEAVRDFHEAVRDFLRAAEDGVDEESGITAVEGGDGGWLAYQDPEMEAPITAVDDGQGSMLEYTGQQQGTGESLEAERGAEADPAGNALEEIDDTVLTPELADEVALPSETAMAAQDAIQAEAFTGAEMVAEPGGVEPSGGIEPGVGR
jgi:hypothetical protein